MMRRLFILAAALAAPRPAACARSTAADPSGSVATTLRSVEVAPIDGQVGWLVHNKLTERLGNGRQAAAPTGSRSSSTTISPASASAATAP